MTALERPGQKAFHRLVFITRDDLLAARWWHEGMEAAHTSSPDRRTALKVLLGMGGLLGAGLLLREGCNALSGPPSITMDALELQRKEGWAVGAQGQILLIPGSNQADSAGNKDWAASLSTLGQDLAPKDARLDPFYVPTLFEVLNNPRGAGLAQLIRPMQVMSMQNAQSAAQGLSAMFADEKDRKNTALILDMPGPDSVAAAAGVARVFAPVFLFDNWPHPMGVVPSHHTLAAAIYHRPEFVSARAERPSAAPPAFVLDSDRLAPYRDESDKFDNRYVARMPTADNLAKLGIERVLYVTAIARGQESDDLNDDFVAFKDKSISVKLIALSDFGPASPNSLQDNNLPPTHYHHYYYGGHPMGHLLFWSSYGWSSPTIVGRSWQGSPPRPVSTGAAFAPAPRPTLFSSRSVGGLSGVGKQKPSGFGRVSYRASSSGGGFGRSGSFGRTSFSGSG